MTQPAAQASAQDLFSAIREKDEARVKKMLAERPELVSARNADGFSPLTFAAYHRASKIVHHVLAAGCQPTVHEACILGDVDRVRAIVLADSQLASTAGPDGFYPLHLAAHFGQTEILRFLLELGEDVDRASANALATRPLISALAGGQEETACFLVKHGADPNGTDSDGNTALHSAAANGLRDACEALLKAGGNPHVRNSKGKTPLAVALDHEEGDLAERLRRLGATL